MPRSLLVVREERPEKLVERPPVAACDGRGRERPDRLRPRNVHGQGDLTEVVARPQNAARAERADVADREEPRQDDVEAIAGVTLDDGSLADRHLLAAHPLREP